MYRDINLLPHRFREEKEGMGRLNKALLLLGIIAAAGVVSYFLLFSMIGITEKNIDKLEKEKESYSNVYEVNSLLNDAKTTLDGLKAMDGYFSSMNEDHIMYFKALTEASEENVKVVSYSSPETGKLSISCITRKPENIVAFERSLMGSGLFSSADVSNIGYNSKNIGYREYYFSMTLVAKKVPDEE